MLRVAPSSTLFPYTTLFRSEMPVGGERCAEGLEDPYLFRRVRDVVVATQDVGDGVEPVLDRGGEVVGGAAVGPRSEEHTSELQSLTNLVCRLLLEKKKSIISETYCCLERLLISIIDATRAVDSFS